MDPPFQIPGGHCPHADQESRLMSSDLVSIASYCLLACADKLKNCYRLHNLLKYRQILRVDVPFAQNIVRYRVASTKLDWAWLGWAGLG